jgi:chemotaxis protein CheX
MAPKKKITKPKAADKAPAKVVVPKASADSPALKLNDVLDISYAEKLKTVTMEFLEKSAQKGVVLDASTVGRITTPCIQVILSVAKSCSMMNVNFKIKNPSDIFQKAFIDIGLAKQLKNWSN